MRHLAALPLTCLLGLIGAPLIAGELAYAPAPPPMAAPAAGPAVLAAPVLPPVVTAATAAPPVTVTITDDATRAEVNAVAQHSAESLQAVAKDEITLAQATRRAEDTPDPGGSGYVFWMVGIIAAAALRFGNDMLVKKLPSLPNSGSSFFGLIVVGGVFVGAWALLHKQYADLPQTWFSWLVAGVTGAGLMAGARSAANMGTEINQVRTGTFQQRRASDSQPQPIKPIGPL